MSHVVSLPPPPELLAGGRMRLHQVPLAQDNLGWIAECMATGQAAIIDGTDAGPYLEYADAAGINLSTILNTHTHFDHVGVNADLARRGLLPDWRVVGPARAASDVPGLTEGVDEGDTVTLGSLCGRVLLTEGHMNGHITFVFDDVMFCGDTLFTGGCGYLFDGPPETMFASLMRLAQLDGDTRVCCAHEYTQDNLRFAWSVEPDNVRLAERIRDVWRRRAEGRSAVPSLLETERATNPFLRPGSATLRASVSAAMPEVELTSPAAVFSATRALKDRKDYRSITDAQLPLG